jgi:hypothetical protein
LPRFCPSKSAATAQAEIKWVRRFYCWGSGKSSRKEIAGQCVRYGGNRMAWVATIAAPSAAIVGSPCRVYQRLGVRSAAACCRVARSQSASAQLAARKSFVLKETDSPRRRNVRGVRWRSGTAMLPVRVQRTGADAGLPASGLPGFTTRKDCGLESIPATC